MVGSVLTNEKYVQIINKAIMIHRSPQVILNSHNYIIVSFVIISILRATNRYQYRACSVCWRWQMESKYMNEEEFHTEKQNTFNPALANI